MGGLAEGWLKDKHFTRSDGRPTAQWSRLKAGYSDDLGTGELSGSQNKFQDQQD